jgi:hypothetical protein
VKKVMKLNLFIQWRMEIFSTNSAARTSQDGVSGYISLHITWRVALYTRRLGMYVLILNQTDSFILGHFCLKLLSPHGFTHAIKKFIWNSLWNIGSNRAVVSLLKQKSSIKPSTASCINKPHIYF